MKTVLKWIGIGLGGLVGLIIIAVIGLAIYGQVMFHRKVDRPLFPITADTSAAGLARGEYLVRDVISCQGCHAASAGEGQSPPRDAPLVGQSEAVTFGPIQLVFAPSNLTPDAETGLGSWSDAEIARAIREGIGKDGEALAIMPSVMFRNLSDADVAAIVGYLRSLKPVRNAIPPVEANVVGKVVLAIGLFEPPNPAPVISAPVPHHTPGSVEYGGYLMDVSGCRRCHGASLAGGPMPGAGPDDPLAANLTPGGELIGWSQADFLKAMTLGVTPSGRTLNEAMPWKDYARWQEADLKAVYAYLKTVPAQRAP
jgi:mono/diheme cytochrome c family protein